MFVSLAKKLNVVRQKSPVLFTFLVSSFFITFFSTLAFTMMPNTAWAFDVVKEVIAPLLLSIMQLLGKALVVLIEILIGVAQYNDFINAPAVTTGWEVIRDVCNMLFIIILLVIAFGTIMRLENYKYNKLLSTLIIMAILVNFSKMIAGFFIDLGQVIMMTFVNGFKDAAAGNFTEILKLKQMISFRADLDNPPDDWELVGALFLGIGMLIVAIVVMVAMLLVFVVRIVMLWILVVLSPLAYLLNVLPMSKQYASRWWTTFGKYVATGPVLAFFLWLSLTFLSSGGGGDFSQQAMDPEKVVQEGGQVTNVAAEALSGAVSEISKSENMLGYVIGIAMLVMSLMVAQQLGGIAGKFTGTAMSKINAMGASVTKPFKKIGKGIGKVAASPLKGGVALAKMGGRKGLRVYRDSKLGKYTNVAAMYRGAKQRGEELDKTSKDRAAATGRTMWDKRPGAIGGGADVIPAEQMVEQRYEKGIASEVSTLQKEQKAALLQKVWNKGGKQAELTRRALLQSMAAEGHIDDALATDFFKNEAEWTNDEGKKQTGFGSKTGNKFSDAAITSNFLRSSVSSGKKRGAGAGDIEEGALRTLYDIEELGKKAQHYEYAGEVGVGDDGKLRLHSIDEKDEVVQTEINKQTDRKFIGNHPHNFTQLYMKTMKDANGKEQAQQMRVVKEGDGVEWQNFLRLSAYSKANPTDYPRFSAARHSQMLGEFDGDDSRFEINDDKDFMESIKTIYQGHGHLADQLEGKAGSQGYKMRKKDASGNDIIRDKLKKDKDGNDIEGEYEKDEKGNRVKEFEYEKYENLHELAQAKGWDASETYAQPSEKQKESQEKEAKARHAEQKKKDEEAKGYKKQSEEKHTKADGLDKEAADLAKTQKERADTLESEAKDIENNYSKDVNESAPQRKEVEAKRAEAEELKSGKEVEAKKTEAKKLRKEGDDLNVASKTSRADVSAEQFREASAVPDAMAEIKVKFSDEQIQELGSIITKAYTEATKSADGMDIGKFSDQVTKAADIINNNLKGLDKLAPDVKSNVVDQVGGIKQDAVNGVFKTRDNQRKTLDVLNKIQKVLGLRQQGDAGTMKIEIESPAPVDVVDEAGD